MIKEKKSKADVIFKILQRKKIHTISKQQIDNYVRMSSIELNELRELNKLPEAS